MTDLISREAALAALMHMSDAYERIYVLPAAQVDYRAEYYRGWNDAMGSIPKRVIDDPALSPTAVDASQTPDPVLSDPRVKALVEQVRALLDAADGESYAAYNAALEATDAALRAIGGEA